MQVRSLGWEDPQEEEMAPQSNILARKISWAEELGRLQSIESQRVRHDWTCMHRITELIEILFHVYAA